jgi:hypothetical protein
MASTSSKLRITCGLMMMTSSVLAASLPLLLNMVPSNGISPRKGTWPLDASLLVWIMPPSASAWPSLTNTLVLIRRCLMVGESMVELVVVATVDTSCSISSSTRPLALMRGVMARITPVSR